MARNSCVAGLVVVRVYIIDSQDKMRTDYSYRNEQKGCSAGCLRVQHPSDELYHSLAYGKIARAFGIYSCSTFRAVGTLQH